MASTDRVEPQVTAQKKPWTVMVYMAADDSPEMDGYAVNDLREMERGVHKDVNVLVQIRRYWPDVPERYVISRDNGDAVVTPGPPIESGRKSMGDRATLESLLTWAVDKYPADHYMLVLWGHAYGLGFGRDHGDPLQLCELVEALHTFRCARQAVTPESKFNENDRVGILDILGANACAMSYVEGAYQLRNSADYLVASQIYVPFAGWPFTAVLQRIGAETTPEELGRSIIESYVAELNDPLSGERVQMSMLNLKRAAELRGVIGNLAGAVHDAFRGPGRFDANTRARVRDAFIGSAAGDVRPLIDLTDLCRMLERDLCQPVAPGTKHPPALANAIKDVTALTAMSTGSPKGKQSFIVSQATHPTLRNLNGVGIYAPFVTDEQDLKRLGLDDDPSRLVARSRRVETSRESYERLDIFKRSGSKGSTWPALVYDDLHEPISSELTNLIQSVGVTKSSDRMEVAQIVLSIESAFNRVDRVLESAQQLERLASHKQTSKGKTQESPRPLRLIGMAPAEERDGKPLPPLHIPNGHVRHWLAAVEEAVAFAERATRAGLTQARFGIGPVATSSGFAADAPPKHGDGPPDRDGFAPPKHGGGPPPRDDEGQRSLIRSLSPDILPVLELFGQAGKALQRLEAQTLHLEKVVAAFYAPPSRGAKAIPKDDLPVRQAFSVLCEVATSARRVVRRVIANPAYGLGPAPGPFGIDDREELANAAGLGCGNLVLLAAEPSASGPQLANYENAIRRAGDRHPSNRSGAGRGGRRASAGATPKPRRGAPLAR